MMSQQDVLRQFSGYVRSADMNGRQAPIIVREALGVHVAVVESPKAV